MVQHMVCIASLLSSKVVLPRIISKHSVGYVSSYLQPVVSAWHRPIVFKRQPYLRHGARIYAQRLRTAAKPAVFQVQLPLLASYRQCAM